MRSACPHGHESGASDYCDQCGALIDRPAADPGAASATGVLPVVDAPSAPTERCGGCDTPRARRDRYCEACGRDFAAPAAVLPATGIWEAELTADPVRFRRSGAVAGLPADCEPRLVALQELEYPVGRGGPSAADALLRLTGVGADPAISRGHAVLRRQPDGSYAVVDQGSTNGTTINDDPAPIAPNVPVPLEDGDRVHIGAWTTITLRFRTRAA